MAKKSIDDMVTVASRPLERRGGDDRPPMRLRPSLGGGSGGGEKEWFITGGIFLRAVTALIGSSLFSSARALVYPVLSPVTVNGDFRISQSPLPDEPGFDVMTLTKTNSAQVPATGEEKVSERASGKIVIYNNYSTASQRLITNTRFQTTDGLIFRVASPVVVPGMKKQGTEVTPGSIEAEVFADETGEKYNIGLTDFEIPGFRGSPQFGKIFARSKTPMSGGFEGTRPTADPQAVEGARKTLREALQKELTAQSHSEKPEGFLLHDNLVFVTFTSKPDTGDGSSMTLTEEATLHGVLIESQSLATLIARSVIPGFSGNSFEFLSPTALTIQASSVEGNVWEQDSLTLNVVGKTTLVGAYDR